MAADDTTELADSFIEAGWDEYDIPDAYEVIETALRYMDEHDSL